jgi:hypothetical protein
MSRIVLPVISLKRSPFMFDPKKLEHFLDSLQVETHYPSHYPSGAPKMAPHSHLDDLMDKYDVFAQGNFNHNHGTPEFPVYGPEPTSPPSWLPGGAHVTYGILQPLLQQWPIAYVQGIGIPEDPEAFPELPVPIETPHDRLKARLARLSAAAPAMIEDPNPPALSPSPDFVHTITAWRGWEFTSGMLEALGTEAKWEPRRAPRANCIHSSHAAPKFDCSCGYWSFKTFDLLQEALKSYAVDVDVIGQVEIWGRVIECENGFRSEFAYPKELWLLDEGLESLSWKYGVPVRRLPK